MGGAALADSDITTGRLLLLEYERIKEEQRGRITFRDNTLYATLATMAAVIAAVLQADGAPSLLLLLPPVSLVLGWTYLVNDVKVSAIGQYIRTELTPRLAAIVADDEAVFGWERAHRADDRRVSRKALQLAIEFMMFVVAPFVGLVIYWLNHGPHPGLLVVSIVEAVAVVVLAVQIVLYADWSR
jgi:hypothetical protein